MNEAVYNGKITVIKCKCPCNYINLEGFDGTVALRLLVLIVKLVQGSTDLIIMVAYPVEAGTIYLLSRIHGELRYNNSTIRSFFTSQLVPSIFVVMAFVFFLLSK